MAKWLLKQSSADIKELARQLGISPVLARILAVRGFRTAAEAEVFLAPEKLPLADPFLFTDMLPAVEVAAEALYSGSKCSICGDYDADGITSTVILLRTLRKLGLDVTYDIPQREGTGYGMSKEALQKLSDKGVEVIFACDNGISAFEQIEFANRLGMTVVVLDHHAVTFDADNSDYQVLPDAAAVVDSQRNDCGYPFKHYCAAGVCYRFSEALYNYLDLDWTALGRELLPFVTIGTICDLVELYGENRKLVKMGLPSIMSSNNPGLRELIKATGLAGKEIGVYQIGFILGPCINVSGRLDIADTAVELFITADTDHAASLAIKLVELNQQRRTLTEQGTADVLRLLEKDGLADDKVIVLHSDRLSESVAGIVAGRVKELYYRPTIILVGNQELVRGSCRSIESYNIYEGLFSCRDLLNTFGGHPMAAGLSLARDNIAELRIRLNSECILTDDDLQPTFRIDCPLSPDQATLNLARELNKLAPFGKGNPSPLFAVRRVALTKIQLLGRAEQVLKMHFSALGKSFEAIDFGHKEQWRTELCRLAGDTVWDELLRGKYCGVPLEFDLLYYLKVNSFNGYESPQLQIVDFRPAV